MIRPEYLQTVFVTDAPAGGWPPQFTVLTACNPRGEAATPETNALLEEQLRRYCEDQSLVSWPVIGGTPDWHYHERGVGLPIDLAQALTIGRNFDQDAIFWIEEDNLCCVACDTQERVQMGSWSARLVRGLHGSTTGLAHPQVGVAAKSS